MSRHILSGNDSGGAKGARMGGLRMSDDYDEYDEREWLELTPLAVIVVKLDGDVEKAASVIDGLADYASSLLDDLSSCAGIAFTDEEPRGMFVTLSSPDDWDDEGVIQ